MTINKGLLSSTSNQWETPHAFFNRLDAEFHFTLDAAASPENAKCGNYYTEQDNALRQIWRGVVWCNPPYGRVIGRFVEKGYKEAQLRQAIVVMLIPSRTDTRYWHDHVMKAKEIRFVKGRLKFGDSSNSAPFPSAVVVFEAGSHKPTISTMEAYQAPCKQLIHHPGFEQIGLDSCASFYR